MERGATITEAAMLDHVRINSAHDLPWFLGAPRSSFSVCIVGGGPSLSDSLDSIRLRSARGPVWVMNNAWRLLVAARIRVDAIVIMDGRPENAAFVQDGPDCEYMIASMAHPDVFDALQGKRVTVWHADQPGGAMADLLAPHTGKPWVLVPGGGTVTLRAMLLALLRGHVDQHVYGVDSCYSADQHHAYPQALNDGEQVLDVPMMDRIYRCAGWMLRQAYEFMHFRDQLLIRGCRITAHGEGLIPDLSRRLNKRDRYERSTFVSSGRRGTSRPGMGRGQERRGVQGEGSPGLR